MSESLSHVITQQDIADLERIHAEIKENEAAFLRVGELLVEVRDRRLFLIHAPTFQDYVKNHWGWTKQRAYQLMDAVTVVKSLPPKSQHRVDSEASARALSRVPKNARPVVIGQIHKSGGSVTPKAIRETAAKMEMPPEDPPPPTPQKSEEPEPLYDKTGFVIPKSREILFSREPEVKELLRSIATVRGALRKANDANDPLFKHVNASTTMSLLDQAFADIKMAMPFVVCPYCQGQVADHCTPCRGTGFLPEHKWLHAVPAELREVRQKACKKS